MLVPKYERPLFHDSLLEAEGRMKTKRGFTTTLSFALQFLFVGLLILLPLWFTDQLPMEQLMVTYLEAPAPPPPPPPPAAPAAVTKAVRAQVAASFSNGKLMTPSSIPRRIATIKEDTTPFVNAGTGVMGGVPGGVPGGQLGGVIGGILSSAQSRPYIPPIAAKAAMPMPQHRVRVSQGVTEGLLLARVVPDYPSIARQARIQGLVVLAAVITKDGTIARLQVISGHPMLAPAAIAAVKQWKYKPYLLNGEPVEVETTINVTFTLSGAQ
jgi:protein TonB